MTPICAKCGKPMTPETARIHPEYFLHDACLPDELRPPKAAPAPDDLSLHQARLRGMIERPGLYSMGAGDTNAIRWALTLIDSIPAEREHSRREVAEAWRQVNALRELAERMTEVCRGTSDTRDCGTSPPKGADV